MPAISPEAVIFDIGRVIVRVDPKRALDSLARTSARTSRIAVAGESAAKRSAKELRKAIENDPRFPDWQEGRLTPAEWHEHISRQLGLAVGFAEFCDFWNQALDPVTILDEQLFARLSRQCRLALLSNTDPIHAEHLERAFSFLRYFPVRIYSCRVAARKPDAGIYHSALRALGVAPRATVYIDDISEFVEAARQLGLDAIHFESAGQLQEELSRRGLQSA